MLLNSRKFEAYCYFFICLIDKKKQYSVFDKHPSSYFKIYFSNAIMCQRFYLRVFGLLFVLQNHRVGYLQMHLLPVCFTCPGGARLHFFKLQAPYCFLSKSICLNCVLKC